MASKRKSYRTKLTFDNMSSEDLVKLLKQDIHADNSNELEPSNILKILEVLEKRDYIDKGAIYPNINDSFLSFKENYLPYITNTESLYNWETENKTIESHALKEIQTFKRKNKPYNFNKLKRLSIVTVVFIAVTTLFFNTTALGGSFWQSVAQWGRETFWFSEGTSFLQMNNELTSLHEALTEQGITELLAPTWIPDGYKLIGLDATELPEKVMLAALFEYDEKILIIQIINHINHEKTTYEKSDEEIYIYPQNGINHYIMSNIDLVNVVWSNQNYECLLSGNITKGDAQLIINSIYER
ncbi:MAG: DUF4367 domain-containing protein [Oscillospiraceae bacterium]|nr:DUF4367 domain-containing protein [Oscillospiraceae bacterium]